MREKAPVGPVAPTARPSESLVPEENPYDASYLEWKDWKGGNFGQLTQSESACYAAELRRTGRRFPPGTRVLDIGYGSGPFMGYGRRQGWEMHGAEVNPILLKIARDHGFTAHAADSLGEIADQSFDLITAFDVLEHIPQTQMIEFLIEAKRLLRVDGCLLARFPNGDSPFGLLNQHGDVTHVTILGSGKARYFAGRAGFELLYLGGAAQPLRGATHRQILHRLVAVPVKAAINFLVNLIFFPGVNVAFCATNMVMICRRNRA
ncbi:MAG: class I SAM-dependent methyltransferase [Pseudomonadota bacterium]|nr:class I SAM-dependent methyltransferase [Pseudomonadota bacterium]